MYALSVRQPFASQIVTGLKTIEWRSKPFKYRGPLVICASKTQNYVLANGNKLPVGVALGIVDVVDCRWFTDDDLEAACCQDHWGPVDGFAWVLENPREVKPIPVKGIVAPWPWKGPELKLMPGWHEKHVLRGSLL